MKKLLFLTFGVIAILLASHTEILACSCLRADPKDSLEKRVNDARNASTAVFAGTVLKKSLDGSLVVVRFRVERSWKGSLPVEVDIFTGPGAGGDCGFGLGGFVEGSEYLVYASGHSQLFTGICQRTKALSVAAEDLKILGEGKVPSIAPLGSYAHGWRLYSLAGTNSSVQSPAPFRRVPSYEGEHGIGDKWPSKRAWPGFVAYVAQEPSKSRDYAVIVFPRTKQIRALLEDDKDSLEWFIGGDDDSKPTSVLSVYVGGVEGKEYVYTKEVSSDTYTRGRVLDSGAKVYILIFKSSTPKDLSSDDATRFLDSFRLQKKTRGAKK